MNAKQKITSAAAAVMLLGAAGADAALVDGINDTVNYSSSVFLSIAERDDVNQVVRNLFVDTGASTWDSFASTPWSTTAAQEATILGFINNATTAGHTVKLTVGGALVDLSFATDKRAFLASSSDAGPAVDGSGFPQLDNGIVTVLTVIGNINQPGVVFDANGILAANTPSDPGWHDSNWGSSYNGTLFNNEVLFGNSADLTGWKMNENYEIVRSVLGPLTSDVTTGDVSFNAVPLPGAVWLFGSAIGLAGAWRRRSAA